MSLGLDVEQVGGIVERPLTIPLKRAKVPLLLPRLNPGEKNNPEEHPILTHTSPIFRALLMV